jgi:hypothetical protein
LFLQAPFRKRIKRITKRKILSATIQSHTALRPRLNTDIHRKVDTILTPHRDNIDTITGVFVSPIPLKIPSNIISAPNMGSDMATMRSTEAPDLITTESFIKIDIIASGNKNKIVPVMVIIVTAIPIIVTEV